MLNHTDSLKMDQRHIDSRVLSSLYGFSEPEIGKAFKVKQGWVVQYGKQLLFNGKPLKDYAGHLLAVVQNDDFFILGTSGQVLLYTHEGKLVDSLETPEPLLKMGWYKKQLVIHTAEADFLANKNVTQWQTFRPDNNNKQPLNAIHWSKADMLPAQQIELIKENHSGYGPTLEQVILDTHSGRLFGVAGVYFADLIAGLTILLTLIGVYLWVRRKKQAK